MWLRCSLTGRWAWYFSTYSQYAQIAQYLNTFVRVVSLVWQGAVWLGAGHGTFYVFTICIIPEYSYTFVYYQHWCDLGAVWLGAGRDTQTFLAAYTTCSLSSDSPAKRLKISSPVMRGIEIFKNWQIYELNTCSLSSEPHQHHAALQNHFARPPQCNIVLS